MEKIVLPDIKKLHQLDVYVENGGFKAIRKALKQSPDDIKMELHAKDYRQTKIFVCQWR